MVGAIHYDNDTNRRPPRPNSRVLRVGGSCYFCVYGTATVGELCVLIWVMNLPFT
jgi:hypothetical protein